MQTCVNISLLYKDIVRYMFSYDIWIRCTHAKPTLFMTSHLDLNTTKTHSSRIILLSFSGDLYISQSNCCLLICKSISAYVKSWGSQIRSFKENPKMSPTFSFLFNFLPISNNWNSRYLQMFEILLKN